MFNHISRKYDFLNHFLSLGIDKYWRKRVRKIVDKSNPKKILDVATGTGDLAIELSKINEVEITGVDIALKMLEKGKAKIKKKKLEQRISFFEGDAENIKFSDNEFDVVTVAFGVRNFENINLGLSEIHRVLNNNGQIVVLEFSKPKVFPVKQIFNLYFKNLLPFFGRLFSKDKSAYRYLFDSVLKFPDNEDFLRLLKQSGFKQTKQYRMTFGISTIYIGQKL